MHKQKKGFIPHLFGMRGSKVTSNKKGAGFTLIELLVVIAIIGLLSTLAVVALTSARAKARDAKRVSDVKQIQTALELFFADKGQKYPVTTATLGLTGTTTALCSTATTGFAASCGTDTTYMGKVPRDPSGSATTVACVATTAASASVCDYAYASTDGSTYSLWFRLENDSGELKGGATGNTCASPNGMKTNGCI